MIRAIDAAEQAIRGLNSYPDPEDKEQRLAEVGAGKTLLGATRARVDAVRATIWAALTYLTDKVVDNLVAIAITAAVAAVATYFGFTL